MFAHLEIPLEVRKLKKGHEETSQEKGDRIEVERRIMEQERSN